MGGKREIDVQSFLAQQVTFHVINVHMDQRYTPFHQKVTNDEAMCKA